MIDWPNACTTSGGPLYTQTQTKSSGSTSSSFSVVSELIDVSSLSDGFTMYFSFADAWTGGVGISYSFGALTITEDVPD